MKNVLLFENINVWDLFFKKKAYFENWSEKFDIILKFEGKNSGIFLEML